MKKKIIKIYDPDASDIVIGFYVSEERPNQTNTLEEMREEFYKSQFAGGEVADMPMYEAEQIADFWLAKLTSSNSSLIERIREFVEKTADLEPESNGRYNACNEIRNFLSTLNERE